ncbi:MAG: acyl carrier protein [Butyrivibrio sp.]|nr:acyl carrier protein [Butyrivibrio sp.]
MSETGKNNLKKYKDVFCSVLNVTEDVLNESFTFHDVEVWDSIAHFTLISELEDAFDIMFNTEDILHYGSYLNGIAILKRYGVEFD